MQKKNLLLISIGSPCQTTLRVATLLQNKGIGTTLISPRLANFDEFNLFSQLLSTHPFVASFANGTICSLIHNFRIQQAIQKADCSHFIIPDMWVQFGNKNEFMLKYTTDAETIFKNILQFISI